MKLPLFLKLAMTALIAAVFPAATAAGEAETRAYFQQVRNEPTLLRGFLYAFPKGGELHNHLDGAIYAESYIRWAAEDGKCIDLESFMITPRRAAMRRPAGRPSATSAMTPTW